MKPTRGFWWDEPVKKGENDPKSESNVSKASSRFAIKSYDQHLPEIFPSPKSDILIHLCKHCGQWETVANIRALLGKYKYSPRPSQLIREIVEKLEELPGTRYEPAQLEDTRGERTSILDDEERPGEVARGERKMGTWFVPVLDGELVFERKTRKIRISYQATVISDVEERADVAKAQTPHVPRQLPTPPSPFIERADNLRWLRERRPENGVLLAGLRGMGGSGKTSLAVFLAHEWKDRFPDGQLYLELNRTSAHSPESIDNQTQEQLRRAIRAFKVQPPASNDIGELTSSYRDVLASRRVLIVLDNAQEQGQIMAFVPPEGCGLIATARPAFSLGASPARLVGRMEDGEAERLLLGLYSPLTEKQLHALVRLCAGSPLALRIVGSALATEEEEKTGGADIGAALTRLSNSNRLTILDDASANVVPETVTQTFRLSEVGLTEEEKLVWWTLGVFPADFDAQAATAVTGAPQSVLEKLVRRSLLERAESRYRLHDFVRDYTLACLHRDIGKEYLAHLDHATHYVELLREQSLAYSRGGDEMITSLYWFDDEWNNIKAGQEWARDNRESSRKTADMCLEFPIGASNFLKLHVHPDTAIVWYQSALSVYESMKYPDKINKQKGAKLFHNLAIAHSQLGKLEEASRCCERCLALIIELNQPDLDLETNARSNWGWILYKLQLNVQARRQYRTALRAAEHISDERNRVNARIGVLQNLGIYHKSRKKYDSALRCYNEVLREAIRIRDPLIRAKALGNIGVVFHLQGDPAGAIVRFQQQLDIAKNLKDTEGQASAQYNEALATYDQGDMRRALFLTDEALHLFKSIGHPMADDAEYNLRELQEELGEQ